MLIKVKYEEEMKNILSEYIEIVKKEGVHDILVTTEIPSNLAFGDLVLSITFKLAKKLGRSPAKIADDIGIQMANVILGFLYLGYDTIYTEEDLISIVVMLFIQLLMKRLSLLKR